MKLVFLNCCNVTFHFVVFMWHVLATWLTIFFLPWSQSFSAGKLTACTLLLVQNQYPALRRNQPTRRHALLLHPIRSILQYNQTVYCNQRENPHWKQYVGNQWPQVRQMLVNIHVKLTLTTQRPTMTKLLIWGAYKVAFTWQTNVWCVWPTFVCCVKDG